ncbi:MAG: chloride channel protein [Candidatus Roseilinea sp.]|nr:MAG: chloride channel protein [Candidatus Roseilinea sp.]
MSLSPRSFIPSDSLRFGGLAVLVGLMSGAGIWLFKWLIEFVHGLALGAASGWWLALVPVIGGLLVGLLAHFTLGEEKLHGTASVMQAVALAGGRLRYQKLPAKTLAAILSIGAGASVGPEDPSVQIGANLGSMVGQVLRLSEERVRTLVAAGAASAIAAAFNAPIAGVFFALEILLGEVSGVAVGMILVAAVTSSVFTQAVSGTSPAFPVPAYALNSPWELPLYLLLGLLAGPVAALYVRLLYRMQDLFGGWQVPRPLRTAAAGALVGLTGLILPQVLGVGYETIGEVLNRGDFGLGLLLALLAAKVILTPVSIGGGFFGGVFAPSLFIGAMLGGAFGLGMARLFPGLGIAPAAFALVGMAAVLAGAVHAPLTAVLLLFEMTRDYRIILPLMFSVAVGLIVSQHISRHSVYGLGLARHGIRLDRGRDVNVLSALTVGEVMDTGSPTLPESMPLEEAAALMARLRRQGLPVVDQEGKLCGMLATQDLERPGRTVGEACTRKVEVAYPDETLHEALERMSRLDVGRLPVVSRDDPRRLVGLLRRSDVVRAYEVALKRRVAQRHHESAVRLDALTPPQVEVLEMEIEAGAPADGCRLSEVAIPTGCVIASLRRGGRVFVPRGGTVLHAGDVLVVTVDGRARERLLEQLQQMTRRANA